MHSKLTLNTVHQLTQDTREYGHMGPRLAQPMHDSHGAPKFDQQPNQQPRQGADPCTQSRSNQCATDHPTQPSKKDKRKKLSQHDGMLTLSIRELDLCTKAISGATNGFEHHAGYAQRFTQTLHMNVDRSFFNEHMIAPNLVQ